MKLFICGNGFDKHIGFDTDYNRYREFLLQDTLVDNDVVNRLNNSKYFGVSKMCEKEITWSNLEEGLDLDYKVYIENYLKVSNRKRNEPGIPVSKEELKEVNEFRNNDFQIYAHEFTKYNFDRWIINTYFSSVGSVEKNYQGFLYNLLSKQDCYLTFNYTTSLEDIFGIERDKIMYIHNRFPRSQKDGKLEKIEFNENWEYEMRSSEGCFQFGSAQNLKININEYIKSLKLESLNVLFDSSNLVKEIELLCKELSKDISSNYERLKRFLYKKNIDEVIVLGHSFMGIDLPYYDEVLMPTLKDCKWTIYWFSEEDYKNIAKFEKRFSCEVKRAEWTKL